MTTNLTRRTALAAAALPLLPAAAFAEAGPLDPEDLAAMIMEMPNDVRPHVIGFVHALAERHRRSGDHQAGAD